VARELAEFCERYDESRDGLWLLLQDGRVEGSIAIDGARAAAQGAHLRWFITSDRVRGTGSGTALLSAAMAFCQSRHHQHVYLWTFEGLHAARHLYEKFGFTLAHQQPGTQWGRQVNEQRFERHSNSPA
jgi:GNAT superfamily N-acetyltransferase